MPRYGVAAHRILRIAPILALVACKSLPENEPVRAPEAPPRPPICEGVAPLPRAPTPTPTPTDERFPKIGSTPSHSCALFENGQVACWGANTYRQLGDGTWERRSEPTRVKGISDAKDLSVTEYGACVARANGSVACWGAPWGPEATEIKDLPGVTAVAAWDSAVCGVRPNGGVVCYGLPDRGDYHRIVKGPAEIPGVVDAVDVALGDAGVCVLHVCGRVSCGSLPWIRGEDRERPPELTPIGGLDDARAIAMGSYSVASHYVRTCALRANGRVSCVVSGGVAAPAEPLGMKDGFVAIGGGQGICALDAAGRASCFSPTLLSREAGEREMPDEVTLDSPVSIAHGGGFRCAGLASGKIACWGRSLGGDTGAIAQPLPPGKETDVAHVSTGRHHTCMTRANGDVGCWGPMQLTTVAGNFSPNGYSYLGGRPVAGLHLMAETAAGDGFVCARTRAGEIFCFGRNDKGQLGDGPRVEDRPLPTPVDGLTGAAALVAAPAYACALRAGAEVRCWGAHPLSERLGTKPAAIPELAGALEVAAGDRHVCARLAARRIECVGAKPDFDADTARDAAQIVAGAAHTCLRRSSGRVICKGTPESEKGAGDLPEPAVHIAAGGSETCAVLASGRVTCWGSPSWAAPWSLAKDAVRVSTSGKHACVIRKSGELACWGAHSQGQLGDAAPEQQYAPTIMPSPR